MRFYDDQTEIKFRKDAAEVLERYPAGHQRSAMIPLLHLVQSVDGYVSPNGMELVADIIGCEVAEVSAVATFYSQFKRKPNGEYTVGVCMNAMCSVMGNDKIWDTLTESLGIGHDQNTADGKISLEEIECNAACDYAPVVMINWEFFDNQTPESMQQVVQDIQAGKPVKPTRGPDVTPTFKQVSRILAGFPDEEGANQGVSAGASSTWGLQVADKHHMAAPTMQEVAAKLQAEKEAEEKNEAGEGDK